MKKKLYLIGLGITSLLIASCSNVPDFENPDENVSDNVNTTYLISREDALKLANQAISSLEKNGTRSERTAKIERIIPQSTRSTDNSSILGWYLINYGEDDGFAIISADKRISPVLAFSDKGNIQMSDTIQDKGLASYFSMLAGLSIGATGDTTISITRPGEGGGLTFEGVLIPRKGVKPLLHENVQNWRQSAPYNEYTPFLAAIRDYPDGYQSVVGCVPLSCVMIFSYHEWPVNYYDSQGNNIGLLRSFNWSEMKKDTPTGIKQTARLLEIVGRKGLLNAFYNYGGTGAYTSNIVNTAAKMGYKDECIYEYFDPELAYTYIDQNGPMAISANESINGIYQNSGHCWIVDGYQLYEVAGTGNGATCGADSPEYRYYYHMVWGWGGGYNGYYNMNPQDGSVSITDDGNIHEFFYFDCVRNFIKKDI